MKEQQIQELITKIANLSIDERKETNLTREELDIISAVAENDDIMITPLLSENGKIDLSYFNITEQDLRGFNFNNFILKHCNFRKSQFNGDSLKTILSKANNYKVTLQEINASGEDLSSHIIYDRAVGVTIDLPYNFHGLNLDTANFSNADLTNANFDESSLKYVMFNNANLTGTSFKNSDILGANFEDAIFYPKQLATAQNFDQAIFSNAEIIEAINKELEEINNPTHPIINNLKNLMTNIKYYLKYKLSIIIFAMKRKKAVSKLDQEKSQPAKYSTETNMQHNMIHNKKFVESVKQEKNSQNIQK